MSTLKNNSMKPRQITYAKAINEALDFALRQILMYYALALEYLILRACSEQQSAFKKSTVQQEYLTCLLQKMV